MTIPDIVTDHQFIRTAPVRVAIPPATSVTFQPGREGTLYIGTTVNLVCSVTVDRTLVDTDVSVIFDLPTDSRITTSSAVFNESSFEGMAEFSILLPSDGGVSYGCLSTIAPVESTPFVDPVTNPAVTHTLELTALPPPNVILTPSPLTTAGDTLTITCTATVIEGLVETPSLQWLAPDGSTIGITGNVNPSVTSATGEAVVTGQVYASTLRFMPLRTSHGDNYRCVATITISDLSPVHSAESTDVILQIPPSALLLTLSLDSQTGTEGSAITGTVVSLQGLATLADVVDSLITVTVSWSRAGHNELLNFTEITSPPYTITNTFDPLSVGGVYDFIVAVIPSNPSYVGAITVNASFTIDLQPYPDLVIRETVRSGECGVNDVVTLTGSVSLLPNTATDHTLTYTWTDPDGQPVSASSQDLTLRGGTLVVNNLRANTGNYILTACLTIPGTDVVDHCSTADYPISTEVPGQVEDPACPISRDGGVLNILWQQPSSNAGSVNDYVVEVQEIIHSPTGSQMLGVQTLTPPFRHEVQSGGALMTAVTLGVDMEIPYNVSVMPRNPAGCGDVITITCFTQAGGVPASAPADVSISRSTDSSAITVTWRPSTLVEARGFIEYLAQLHVVSSAKRQGGLTLRVPMDQGSATFTGLDISQNYEASVGTISVSNDAVGPVSERVSVPGSPATQSSLTIVIAVVVVLIVAMALTAVIIIVALRSRRSRLDLTKESRSSPVGVVQLSPLALEDPHQYEDISKYSEVLEKLPTVPERSSGEFSVTPCPAYMPTTRSAHLETEYDEVRAHSEGMIQGQVSVAPVGSDMSGEGPAHGVQPEYENVSAPDKDQKSEAMLEPEYEAVNIGGSS